MQHIELFAGCGGLSLGLAKAGFKLKMANELSPMAAETFAYNFLGENLAKNPEKRKKTLWLSSNYSTEDFSKRLREDPREFPIERNCEIKPDGSNLNGSLIVGNIDMLNKWLIEHKQAISQLYNVDLVSGGPPCQSFSLAGLRQKDNAKNRLPISFATFVKITLPKFVLLENVSGILRPFKDGKTKYYAYFEVAKTFAINGYLPLCLHVNAKYAGVAQNRPRFILIGVREDIFSKIGKTLNSTEKELFRSSELFYSFVKENSKNAEEINDIKMLHVFDLNKQDKEENRFFENTFLADLFICKNKFISVREAIGDLSDTDRSPISDYVKEINKKFSSCLSFRGFNKIENNERIKITPRVARRFRIYQVISQLDKEAKNEIMDIIAGRSDEISNSTWSKCLDFWFLGDKLEKIRFSSNSKNDFLTYLKQHKTKKRTQKALIANQPAPAAMSIADDSCHYSDARTMTAREMARIQSFPDCFVFRSKHTTGGTSRRFEVPVYTQIGNAVPVLLAYALGKCIKKLVVRLE